MPQLLRPIQQSSVHLPAPSLPQWTLETYSKGSSLKPEHHNNLRPIRPAGRRRTAPIRPPSPPPTTRPLTPQTCAKNHPSTGEKQPRQPGTFRTNWQVDHEPFCDFTSIVTRDDAIYLASCSYIVCWDPHASASDPLHLPSTPVPLARSTTVRRRDGPFSTTVRRRDGPFAQLVAARGRAHAEPPARLLCFLWAFRFHNVHGHVVC